MISSGFFLVANAQKWIIEESGKISISLEIFSNDKIRFKEPLQESKLRLRKQLSFSFILLGSIVERSKYSKTASA